MFSSFLRFISQEFLLLVELQLFLHFDYFVDWLLSICFVFFLFLIIQQTFLLSILLKLLQLDSMFGMQTGMLFILLLDYEWLGEEHPGDTHQGNQQEKD